MNNFEIHGLPCPNCMECTKMSLIITLIKYSNYIMKKKHYMIKKMN